MYVIIMYANFEPLELIGDYTPSDCVELKSEPMDFATAERYLLEMQAQFPDNAIEIGSA